MKMIKLVHFFIEYQCRHLWSGEKNRIMPFFPVLNPTIMIIVLESNNFFQKVYQRDEKGALFMHQIRLYHIIVFLLLINCIYNYKSFLSFLAPKLQMRQKTSRPLKKLRTTSYNLLGFIGMIFYSTERRGFKGEQFRKRGKKGEGGAEGRGRWG